MTIKINWVHVPIIGNISVKLDKNALNDLIFIVLTKLYSILPIVTLTFDLQNK